ncbi:hypothetical protein RhiirA4_339302 [Rhizophagus irregularis]|uniref:Uncharacterized protein n=1 Tax=Rhizophagus irregularis TaxID=588596 RepID=A0A2I1G4I6_9GLOM|nr:hypothetical protein RhiirA4_339302 [Rhizophagus irregularis]
MVRALLAKAPTCDQQDRADEIIDLAIEIGGDKKEKLIKVAKTYRQLERNTPKAGQPSELCKKKPRHKELDGLVQAQDPTGKGKDPDPPTHPKPKDPKKPKILRNLKILKNMMMMIVMMMMMMMMIVIVKKMMMIIDY